MIWAKKKKNLIILATAATIVLVPQVICIPYYISLISDGEVNVINANNRTPNLELQSNGIVSDKIDNSNRDQNLDKINQKVNTPIKAIDIPQKPEVVQPEPKPEQPPVIIPIAPEVKPTPILEPEQPPVIIPVAPEVEPIPEPTPEPDPIPVPAPVPVPAPEPEPETILIPLPSPQPDPIPVPAPAPVPAPEPEPIPVPAPAPKPEPIPEPIQQPPKPVAPPKPIRFATNGSILKDGEVEKDVILTDVDGKLYSGETVTVKVIKKDAPPRHKFSNPADREAMNRIPYVHSNAPEIRIEVTEKLRETIREILIKTIREKHAKKTLINYSGRKFEDIDLDTAPLSASVLKYLAEGLVPSLNNAQIDHNGALDSSSFSYVSPEFNRTTGRFARDNQNSRFFSYPSYYRRSEDELAKGKFYGWDRTHVTNDWKFGDVKEFDGIEVYNYTTTNPLFAEKNNSIRVELDAKSDIGYSKFIRFVTEAIKAGRKISSFVIKNMGLSSDGQNQKFNDILKSLPDEIPNLELWLEQPTNTSFLYSLRNKKIGELALYSHENPFNKFWSMNPLSVQNTAYIQTIDYTARTRDDDPNYKSASRIFFRTMVFDGVNYKENEPDPFKEINLGLRMGHYVRNNEPFFQGESGPGVNDPDNSESTNTSWPYLDLSRIPQLKSLRGLNFEFGEPGKKFIRKISRLTLFNSGPTFTISVDELNKSQFHKIMDFSGPGSPVDMLKFTSSVNNLHIVSDGKTLTSEGRRNLETFYRKVGRDVFQFRPILVNKNDTSILNQLSGYDLSKVEENEINFNPN